MNTCNRKYATAICRASAIARFSAQLFAVTLVLHGATGAAAHAADPETVVVLSDGLKLRALLWKPHGRGPFPAVLFNHGSGNADGVDARGRQNQRHPELLGPVFARHGYVFLYLFRRGDGLSAGQGAPSGDRMDSAFLAGGEEARNRVQLQLLVTDEMGDALAGLTVLRRLPEVDSSRIAIVGHSFGGSLTLLLVERDTTVRAAVVFSAAGDSWDRSPGLRSRLMAAVEQMAAPVLFLYAENDYSLGAGKALSSELAGRKTPNRLKVYPAIGHSPEEAHNFVHLRISTWEPDVFAFLDEHMR